MLVLIAVCINHVEFCDFVLLLMQNRLSLSPSSECAGISPRPRQNRVFMTDRKVKLCKSTDSICSAAVRESSEVIDSLRPETF